jgi:RNA polymerase sigma factor (sigma-70 family)
VTSPWRRNDQCMDSAQDTAALAAQLERCHAAAWAWAAACCGRDRDAAHDVLHDAYIKVLQGKARFSGRSSFKTWLFGVIRLTACAARRRRLVLGIFLEPIEAHPELRSSNTCESDGLLHAARRVLAALPQRQREVAALVFEHDLTLAEASTVLGISVGTCRQHYARAKRRLRAALAGGGAGHE